MASATVGELDRVDIIIPTNKTNYTIILCCPCYMPKYVPRLEGIMHDLEGECIMPSNLGTYFGI